MCGPLSDLEPSPFGPEVRLRKGELAVRGGPGERFVALLVAFAILVVGGAVLEQHLVAGVLLMAPAIVPIALGVRASRWNRIADARGWHLGRDLLPWDLIDGLVLHRATAESAEVLTATGARPLAIRVRRRHALRERRIAEDAVARHLHQLGHALERSPVVTSVEVGAERAAVPFDVRCARCAPAA